MAHTVIPHPGCTTTTLELAHKGNINDKTIPERDREDRDFNVTLLASAITRKEEIFCRWFVLTLWIKKKGKSLTKILYNQKLLNLSRAIKYRKPDMRPVPVLSDLFSKASNTGFSRHIKTGCNLPVCVTSLGEEGGSQTRRN